MKKTVFTLVLLFAFALSACTNDTAPIMPQIGGEFETGADGNGKIPTYNAVSEKAKLAALESLAVNSNTEKAVKDGLVLKTLFFGKSKAYVMLVQLDKFELTASVPYNVKPFGTNQSLKGQAENLTKDGKTVIGGVSANPMNESNNEPSGVVINDGSKIYDKGFNDGSVYFGIYEDGKAFIASYSEYDNIYRNKVQTAVCGSQIVVKKGEKQTIYGDDTYTKNRVGAGFTADRNTVVLVYGENITTKQLASLLLANGCAMAISLVKGDLACMTCNATDYGTLAPVGPALFVTEKSN